MPLYCICCELSDEAITTEKYTAAKLRTFLPTIEETIAGLGTCVRVSPLTWLVQTDLAIQAVIEQFHIYIFEASERAFVFELSKNTEWRLHSGEAGDKVAAWLDSHLKT